MTGPGGRALAALALAGCLSGCLGAEEAPFAEVPPEEQVEEASIERGQMLLATGQYDLAYRTFIRHLRVGERKAAAFSGAALALEAQGLLAQARDHFERARALAPEAPTVHNNLGVVYFRLKEYELARQSFRAAFALSSGGNRAAAHNLQAAERALASAQPAAADPAVTMELTRTGRGAYELGALPGAPASVGESIFAPSPLDGLPQPSERLTLVVAAGELAPEADRLAGLPASPVSDAAEPGSARAVAAGSDNIEIAALPDAALPDAAFPDLPARADVSRDADPVPTGPAGEPSEAAAVAAVAAPNVAEPVEPAASETAPQAAAAQSGPPASASTTLTFRPGPALTSKAAAVPPPPTQARTTARTPPAAARSNVPVPLVLPARPRNAKATADADNAS